MSKCKRFIYLCLKRNAISYIALVVSIASIIFVWCRIEPITTDWMGILIGILSMLVMILIGWNIYTVIDFKKEVSKIKQQSDESRDSIIQTLSFMTNESTKQSIATYGSLMELYMKIHKEDAEPFLKYALTTLIYQSIIEDFTGAGIILTSINEAVPSNLGLKKVHKQQLLDLAYRVKHPEQIVGFLDFRERLSNVGTFD